MSVFKKYICVTTLTIAVLLIVSCVSKDGSSLAERQQNITGASVVWEYNGNEYTADITLNGKLSQDTVKYRPATVTVTSPEEIAGITLTYSEDTITATVGNVSLTLPENMGTEVYRIVKSLSLIPEERKGAGNGTGTVVLYEAEIFDGITAFNITYGEDKYPDSAVITWDGGEITVKYNNIATGNSGDLTD